MGCPSGCLMSSASIQKLFCGICSVFRCSFDEFVGENVVSPSCSFKDRPLVSGWKFDTEETGKHKKLKQTEGTTLEVTDGEALRLL